MGESKKTKERAATHKFDPSVEKPRPKAYSYIRMSTKEQLEGGSLDRQFDKTRQFVKDHELDLVDYYDDIGVSAFRRKNVEHGALSRFLEAITAGEIQKGSYLVIESMDRLTRQTVMGAVALLSSIVDAGINVATLDNSQIYTQDAVAKNPGLIFIAVGEMMRAHEESRRKSGLLLYAWSEKRKELQNSKKVMTARIPAWLRINDKKGIVEAIPERSKIVEEIFDLACNGYGIYSIARILNDRDEKPWGSPKRTKLSSISSGQKKPIWRESYISKILSNRAVLGEFQPHITGFTESMKKLRLPEGALIHGYYPRVISDEIFRQASLAAERRRTGSKGRKGAVYANLFSGLLHCVQCGSGMRYVDKGAPPKGGKYLRCSMTVTGGKCEQKVYRYEIVEQTVLSFLESLDIVKVLGGEAQSIRLSEKRYEIEILESQLEAAESKINRIKDYMQKDEGAIPNSAMSMLRESEMERERSIATLKKAVDERDEILDIDPVKQRIKLNQLLSKIRDDDKDERVRARRSLAAEIQRLINTIAIQPVPQFSHEVMDLHVHDSWKKRYEVTSQTRLERYLDLHGFELTIQYRNGEQQIIDAANRSRIKMPWNPRFGMLKLVVKYSQ